MSVKVRDLLDSNVTERSRLAMSTLDNIEKQIRVLKQEQQEMRSQCPHDNYKLAIGETFKFEYTPLRVCIVCEKRLPGITREESLEIVRSYLTDIFESNPADETVESYVHGWNI